MVLKEILFEQLRNKLPRVTMEDDATLYCLETRERFSLQICSIFCLLAKKTAD